MLDIEHVRPGIAELCRQLKVERLDLFGSAATDDFSPASDVDVLVVFQHEGDELFNRFFDLKEGLESLFDRPVDVVIEASVTNPYFKASIDEKRRTLYAA